MGRRKLVSPLDGQEEYILTHTRNEIMKHFNLNYNSVNNYCVRHKLHPVTERKRYELTEEMAKYLREHTLKDTAYKFNVPYTWLIQYVRNNNIKYVRKTAKEIPLSTHSCKRSGETHEMIYELSKTFTYAAIARVFGYTKERVRQICEEGKQAVATENGIK